LDWECDLSGRVSAYVSVRSWVQTPEQQQKKESHRDKIYTSSLPLTPPCDALCHLGTLTTRRPLSSRALLAHVCNPNYSGGRDQENHVSKPAWANSSQDPISKIPNTKRASGVVQGIGPEFKPQYWKKKKDHYQMWLLGPVPSKV
jgi:hypothetical protein